MTTLSLSIAWCLGALSTIPLAVAQDRGDQPWRADVALTSTYFTGTYSQLTVISRAMISYSSARAGNDLLLSGMQVWTKVAEDPFAQVSDDLIVSDIPFLYVHPKVYLHGVGRYTASRTRMLDARLNGGGGVGVTPIRTENVLFRAALGAQIEYANYASSTFNLDVAHDGEARLVPRLVLMSNGWYRVKDTPLSFRYIGDAMVNPMDLADNRQFLDAGIDIRLGPSGWSARLSALVVRDSVVPEGVSPAELRSGLGFAYRTPSNAGGS